MLTADRFIVESRHEAEWHAARRRGVSATAVAEAATPSGFAAVAERIGQTDELTPNDYMRFGTEAEPELMRHAHRTHGILPCGWLIAGEDRRHLATPDGLSIDHSEIAECKTTGKDWATPPIKYRRQVQWQLMVTGARRCLFVWGLRVPDDHGWFYMPWLEPKTLWIERDETMIAELIGVAGRLLSLKEQHAQA